MHNLCKPRALCIKHSLHLTRNSSILTQMYKFHRVIKLLHTLLLLITVVISGYCAKQVIRDVVLVAYTWAWQFKLSGYCSINTTLWVKKTSPSVISCSLIKYWSILIFFDENVLMQSGPDINQSLFEFVNVVDAIFVHALLHYTTDLVVDWVQVWASCSVATDQGRWSRVSRAAIAECYLLALSDSDQLLLYDRLECIVLISF